MSEPTSGQQRTFRRCAHCSAEIDFSRYRAKFCSDRCRDAAKYERRRERRSAGRLWTCAECGADISHMRADAKFCSDGCANQAEYKANLRRLGKLKMCPKCKQEKSAASFHRNKKRADGLAVYCKECWVPIDRARPKRNSDVRIRGNRKRRELVLHLYGGSCSCCGEDRYEFLTVDHVNGDGAAHRRESRFANVATYLHAVWNREGRILDGFRILCWNCNCARGMYGYCPHERKTHDGTNEDSWSSPRAT